MHLHERHCFGNGPQDCDEFAHDGRHHHVRILATRDEGTKPLAQSDLRLPADVLNQLRQRIDPGPNMLRSFRGVTVRPRGFDQGAPGAPVAAFRDAALPSRRAAGVFGRDEPDKCRVPSGKYRCGRCAAL